MLTLTFACESLLNAEDRHQFRYDRDRESTAQARSRFTVTDLGATTVANGISDLGQVVGWFQATSESHAFLYSNGQLEDLWSILFYSSAARSSYKATGISKDGQQITGTSYGIWDVAFLISNGIAKQLVPPMGDQNQAANPNIYPYLMLNSDPVSYGQGVNDSGQDVGYANPYYYYPEQHGFLYGNGAIQDIGTLAGKINGIDGMFSQAYGINERGETVGVSITASGTKHAFL